MTTETPVLDLIRAADILHEEAQHRAKRMWDAGYYTDAIYLKEKADEYKYFRNRKEISDLIS